MKLKWSTVVTGDDLPIMNKLIFAELADGSIDVLILWNDIKARKAGWFRRSGELVSYSQIYVKKYVYLDNILENIENES